MGEKKRVKGKIKDWSKKKIRGDGLEAALAEAAERKLDLSGHVGIDVPFKEYVDSMYPLLNNGRRFFWHPHNEIIADVLDDVIKGRKRNRR